MSAPLAYGVDDLPAIGAALAAALRPGDVVGLAGELGAGKTTLARAILAALGLAEDAPSPSFALVQPYGADEVRLPVAHVDLYRLNDPGELAELGLEEYRADGVLLIEWPERLGAGAWPDMLALRITGQGDQRRLTAQLPAAWKERWPL